MTSVHTEYDYRGKGECITLSTLDNTYFLYPLKKEFNVTKVQFATEELYRHAMEFLQICKNLIPITIFCVLIALGLLLVQNTMIKGFIIFGRIMDGAWKLSPEHTRHKHINIYY